MRKMTIRLDAGQARKIEQLCAQSGMPAAAVARELIRRGLELQTGELAELRALSLASVRAGATAAAMAELAMLRGMEREEAVEFLRHAADKTEKKFEAILERVGSEL